MSEALLQIDGLKVRYGAIEAVKSLDLHINEGERVTLIGANGAGKSSSLKALTGLLPAAAGQIRFAGRSILSLAPHERLTLGIAMVPEGRGIFARMSVLENLQAGAFLRRDPHQVNLEIRQLFEHFPRLEERLQQSAGLLSGGRAADARPGPCAAVQAAAAGARRAIHGPGADHGRKAVPGD